MGGVGGGGVMSEDDLSVDKRGRKSLCKAKENLSGKFEKRGEEPHSQSGVECSGKGRGEEI